MLNYSHCRHKLNINKTILQRNWASNARCSVFTAQSTFLLIKVDIFIKKANSIKHIKARYLFYRSMRGCQQHQQLLLTLKIGFVFKLNFLFFHLQKGKNLRIVSILKSVGYKKISTQSILTNYPLNMFSPSQSF